MKYVLIVGDGMSDLPVGALGGKTPLQVAKKPNIDKIAKMGVCGLFSSVPRSLESGTDVAHLSIFGYEPEKYYTGRAPIEAAAMGIELGKNDIAVRCNLVYANGEYLEDYSGGHVKTEEAHELIKTISKHFGGKGIEFYAGVGYRHILVLRNYSGDIKTMPPHNLPRFKISEYLVKPTSPAGKKTAELLNHFILSSREILGNHPVNKGRISKGERPANMVWFWGQGKKPTLENFEKKYGVSGAVISAVDIVRGIGRLQGMEVIRVPGATGYYDTNYEGKAEYGIKALERHGFVIIHVEAPDEAGHTGDANRKIEAIEALDSRLVAHVWDGLEKIKENGEDFTLGIISDHHTAIDTKAHEYEPVPFAFMRSNEKMKYNFASYDEESAKKGPFLKKSFMDFFMGKTRLY
ncbi:MAG: cofactor-independent phosphoglycerate mutase [Candidatus Micrarchaeia archaeon]